MNLHDEFGHQMQSELEKNGQVRFNIPDAQMNKILKYNATCVGYKNVTYTEVRTNGIQGVEIDLMVKMVPTNYFFNVEFDIPTMEHIKVILKKGKTECEK